MDRTGERDPSDPLVGRLLDGRYRIGSRIASGGMASVYTATDVRLDRTVAVKVMHPGMGNDREFADRFVREARHAAKLSHPNVVGVHDQGEEDGTIFLVMEYVPGPTLRDLIREQAPLSPLRALGLVEPVLAALADAHRTNLIHRDIKPENVLVAGTSAEEPTAVKVADFGLAKAINPDTQHTATGGVLIGTVSYLAPELVVDGRADARADVYAVGVVLYELLTGRKPHEGETPIQVAYKHVHEDVPAPSATVPGLPAYVDALVARATARDRGHRPADARVLLHQVHRVRQALLDGIEDDPELVADLAPPPSTALDDVTMADIEDGGEREDTARDPVAAPAAPAAPSPGPRPGGTGGNGTAPGIPTAAPGRGSPVPRRSRRWAWLLVPLLVLLLAAAHWWFAPVVTDLTRWRDTPNVLGLTQADAEAELDDAGLTVELGEPEYSTEFAKGEVISTDPGPSDKVLDDGTVTLVISRGEELYRVPRVRGKAADAAQDLITEHFEYGRTIERYHPKIAEGKAIRTMPETGVKKPPSTAVDLVVSKGPRPIKVGDWTGKKADRAEQRLSAQGLDVKVTEEFSGDVAEGRVIEQDPDSGHLFRGDTVELTVSKGPELVEVPSLRGSGVADAEAELKNLGFKVRTEQSDIYLGLGYVASSDPSAGTMAPKGSTVTLYLV